MLYIHTILYYIKYRYLTTDPVEQELAVGFERMAEL